LKLRLTAGVIVSVALWLGIGGATYAFVATRHPAVAKSSVLRHSFGASIFSHIYPPDPAPYERPAVGTSSPLIPPSRRVPSGDQPVSPAELAADLHARTLVRRGPTTWVLERAIEFDAGTALTLTGPLRLELAPGAFIVAERGAAIRLTGVTVVAVDRSGLPEPQPLPSRGFIDARHAALIVLSHDTFVDLGHLGDQAYGVTLDGASPRSAMVDCAVSHDYFGIYLGRLSGGVVSGNRIADSFVYGIDPHTWDRHLVIEHNHVSGSGVHGIIVADHASDNTIVDNVVTSSHDHGIVVVQFSDGNVISGNVVRDTFDGIVVSDSSGNRITGNRIGPVDRFGLRISGLSADNLVEHNAFGKAILGAYLYQGATRNRLVDNTFTHEYETVRVRSDAPRNVVSPAPPRSEL
jgi:parallel beta-helix repeat protein